MCKNEIFYLIFCINSSQFNGRLQVSSHRQVFDFQSEDFRDFITFAVFEALATHKRALRKNKKDKECKI